LFVWGVFFCVFFFVLGPSLTEPLPPPLHLFLGSPRRRQSSLLLKPGSLSCRLHLRFITNVVKSSHYRLADLTSFSHLLETNLIFPPCSRSPGRPPRLSEGTLPPSFASSHFSARRHLIFLTHFSTIKLRTGVRFPFLVQWLLSNPSTKTFFPFFFRARRFCSSWPGELRSFDPPFLSCSSPESCILPERNENICPPLIPPIARNSRTFFPIGDLPRRDPLPSLTSLFLFT